MPDAEGSALEFPRPDSPSPQPPAPQESPVPQQAAPQAPPAFTPHPAEKKAFFDKRLTDRPERFEDFEPWQEARRFVNRVFEITERPEFAEAPGVRQEIRRAAIATMSQLAAAVESGHDRDFTRGLNQAGASAATVRSLMYVTIDQQQLPEVEANELVGRAASLKRMIGSQIARLKRTETRDFKRKSSGPGGGYGNKPSGGGYGNKKPYGGGGGNRPDKPKFRPKREG